MSKILKHKKMNLKHKIARPGYSKSPCTMSPLNQKYSNVGMENIFDKYKFDVDNYLTLETMILYITILRSGIKIK